MITAPMKPNPNKLPSLGTSIAEAERRVGKLRADKISWTKRRDDAEVVTLSAVDFSSAKNETGRKIIMEAELHACADWKKARDNVEALAALLAEAESELAALKAERRGIEMALYFGRDLITSGAGANDLAVLNAELYGERDGL